MDEDRDITKEIEVILNISRKINLSIPQNAKNCLDYIREYKPFSTRIEVLYEERLKLLGEGEKEQLCLFCHRNKAADGIVCAPCLEKPELAEMFFQRTLYAKVSGVRVKERQQLLRNTKPGESVIVTRDLFDVKNKRAMAVYLREKRLGNVEKKYEKLLSELFDEGYIFYASVQEVTGKAKGGIKGVRVRIDFEQP